MTSRSPDEAAVSARGAQQRFLREVNLNDADAALQRSTSAVDCCDSALRLPKVVVAKQVEKERRANLPTAPLSFFQIQTRMRDFFVGDIEGGKGLLQRHYLTGSMVETVLYPLFQRADAKAVRTLGEVWRPSRDPSYRLSDQILAVLRRRRQTLLQGTEMTLQEVKEKMLLTARLQEPLTLGEVRRFTAQLGPETRHRVESHLWNCGDSSSSSPDPDAAVDAAALYNVVRDMMTQRSGSFTFENAYYTTVLDSLIELDEQMQSLACKNSNSCISHSERARACEEMLIFTLFCGLSLPLDTYFLAVALLDRYLTVVPLQLSSLRLYSMATLLLASKCDHSWPTLDLRFVCTKMELSVSDVMAAEKQIVAEVGYNTSVATLHHFATAFLVHQDPSPSSKQRHLLHYIIATLSVHTYLGQYKQSCLAAAALHCSRHGCEVPTGEPSEAVRVLLPILYAALQKNEVEKRPGHILKQIYACREYEGVSQIPMTTLFPSLSCRSSLASK